MIQKQCFFSNIPLPPFSNYFRSKADLREKKFGISDVKIFGLQNGINTSQKSSQDTVLGTWFSAFLTSISQILMKKVRILIKSYMTFLISLKNGVDWYEFKEFSSTFFSLSSASKYDMTLLTLPPAQSIVTHVKTQVTISALWHVTCNEKMHGTKKANSRVSVIHVHREAISYYRFG